MCVCVCVYIYAHIWKCLLHILLSRKQFFNIRSISVICSVSFRPSCRTMVLKICHPSLVSRLANKSQVFGRNWQSATRAKRFRFRVPAQPLAALTCIYTLRLLATVVHVITLNWRSPRQLRAWGQQLRKGLYSKTEKLFCKSKFERSDVVWLHFIFDTYECNLRTHSVLMFMNINIHNI
jgi:hypothetical protein